MGFLGQLAAESELIAVTGFVGGTQLGKPTLVNSAVFFNIVQTAFDLVRFPNPHYVVGWGTPSKGDNF